MSEAPGTCSKPIDEPCLFHPVDCPNCRNRAACQMKPDMLKYRSQIKRCKFFTPVPGYRRTPQTTF